MKKIPFEKSILAEIGWSEEDYIDVVCNMAGLKTANNIPLTPNESWVYLNRKDLKEENSSSISLQGKKEEK